MFLCADARDVEDEERDTKDQPAPYARTAAHRVEARRGGASLSAPSALAWFQSARKICPAPAPERLDVQARRFPSGDGTGSPSKPTEYVTWTGSFAPSTSTMNSSKLSCPSLFEAKMTYCPDGCS